MNENPNDSDGCGNRYGGYRTLEAPADSLTSLYGYEKSSDRVIHDSDLDLKGMILEHYSTEIIVSVANPQLRAESSCFCHKLKNYPNIIAPLDRASNLVMLSSAGYFCHFTIFPE